MGNYEQLKQAVADVIKTNGNQEITGAILQNALLTIISTIGKYATYAGVAVPTTNPRTPDQNIFYIASKNGVYSNFGNIEIENEVAILLNSNGTWVKKETFISSAAQSDRLNISLGYKPLLRQIAIHGQSGKETFSKSRATTQFLATENIEKIKYPDGYTNAQTVYFDDSFTPRNYYINDVDSNNETIIKKNFKYFKLSIKKTDGSDIDNIDSIDIVYELITKDYLLSLIVDNENLLNTIVQKDQQIDINIKGYITANGSITDMSGNWYSTDFIEYKGETLLFANVIGSNSTNVKLVTFYDSKKNILPEYTIDAPLFYGLIPYYNGVSFVRVSGVSSSFKDYTPFVYICNTPFALKGYVDSSIEKLRKEIIAEIFEVIPLEKIPTESGLIETDGSNTFNGDSNWTRTQLYSLQGINNIEYFFKSSSSAKLFIAFYENLSLTSFISGKEMSGGATIQGVIKNSEFPKNANYFRCSFKSATFGSYEPILNLYSLFSDESSKISDETIFPKNIYLVCNAYQNSVYLRNSSPCIYLDHMFKTLNKEYDIKFADGGVKRTFDYKASADSSWNPTLNSNMDVDNFQENIVINGNDIKEINFDINVFSTKSTVGKDKIARVLVIGSSTVYGEGATYLSNGMQNVKPYHAICYELFKKDNIEQSGGNLYFPLGTLKHANLSFTFNEETYNYDDYHEGRRGQSIQQTIESTPVFLDDSGQFSLIAWLENYRTLTDKGERLYFDSSKTTTGVAGDSNIGYLEDGSVAKDEQGQTIYIGKKVTNTLSYNVCEPSHIVYHLGANGGGTKEQYEELVGYANRDFPNAFVALVMNDSMGTIFPSSYFDAGASKCRWNLTDSRHELCFNIQKVYNDFETEEYKQKKVYVLPFFFVSNPLFLSARQSNLPEFDYNGGFESQHLQPFGWLPTVHADIRAHSNYAYQLYSWIKYTFSLN
jgi:hypothetical protein